MFAIPQPGARWSIHLVVFGVAVVVAFFIALNPPGYRPPAMIEPPPVAEAQGGGEFGDGEVPGLSEALIQVVPIVPTVVTPQERARSVLTLKIGPDDRYVTVGQIASGARVEVVGRNEKGDWLAISLNLGSTTYGWVRASGVVGVANVSSLPVAPVKLLR